MPIYRLRGKYRHFQSISWIRSQYNSEVPNPGQSSNTFGIPCIFNIPTFYESKFVCLIPHFLKLFNDVLFNSRRPLHPLPPLAGNHIIPTVTVTGYLIRNKRRLQGAQLGGHWGRGPPPTLNTLVQDMSLYRGATHFTLKLRSCIIFTFLL